MDTDHPVMLYLRSGLNWGLLGGTAVVALVGALLLGPLGKVLVPLAAVVGYLSATVAMLRSRAGAGAIIKERDEDRAAATAAAIRSTEAERERIAFLRIADEGVRKIVEYFLQVAGEYLETCRKLGVYSPEASQKIHDVLALLQVYLERLDGASTNEEYGLADKEAVSSARRTSATEAAASIREAAAFIRERMSSELGVLAAQDRQAIMDEMEGKQ